MRARKVGMLVGLEVFAGSHCVGDVEASFVLGRVFKAPGKSRLPGSAFPGTWVMLGIGNKDSMDVCTKTALGKVNRRSEA